MNLEDMVSLTERPLNGLELIINYIREEMEENYYFFKKHNNKELHKKLMSMILILATVSKYLQDLREEFRKSINT